MIFNGWNSKMRLIQAFDASMPDKGKPGESITVTCPHCRRYVKINTGVEYSNVKIKNIINLGLVVSGVIILPISFVALMMEEILMIGFMMAFMLPIIAIPFGITLSNIKKESKNGIYYGLPNIADEYHFIN